MFELRDGLKMINTLESNAYWRGYHDAEELNQEGEMSLWLIKFIFYSAILVGLGMVLIKAIIDYV